MNKHVVLAILLIIIFFMFTTCGAKEMFTPSPGMIDVMEDEDIDMPISPGSDMIDMPVSPGSDMNSDFDVDLPAMVRNGQPAAPMPSVESEMGYYNFSKTMYM